MGPQDILLNLSLDFVNETSSSEVEQIISSREQKIKIVTPDAKRIFIKVQSLHDHRFEKVPSQND